jgi:predicted nucleic acid-binding protein
MKLPLDSVILIDHFNGVPDASNYLAAHGADAAVSVITRAEVLVGFDGRSARKVKRFLDCFPTLAIDQATADVAAALRRKHGWRLPDAFQAALARRHELRLVTRDSRDFPPRRHRFVVIPYRI